MSFVPLAALVAILDLVAAALGWETLRIVTKPLPSVILAFAVFRTQGAQRALAVGLLLAAFGDEMLLRTTNVAFLAGMAAFAAMHVSYIVAFMHLGSGAGLVRRRPWVVLPYLLAVIVTNVLLWPHAGTFALPVAIYGVLLAAMALAALDAAGRMADARAGLLIAGGAIVFMASDTLLAFAKFWPKFSPTRTTELAIVGTYFLAQIAIASGVIAAALSERRHAYSRKRFR